MAITDYLLASKMEASIFDGYNKLWYVDKQSLCFTKWVEQLDLYHVFIHMTNAIEQSGFLNCTSILETSSQFAS